MTIELDQSETASEIGEANLHDRPAAPEAVRQGNGAYEGQHISAVEHNAQVGNEAEAEIELAKAVVVPRSYNAQDAVPGFEESASHCLNRALEIARSLNQTSLSSDHLMLALTMDPTARRHLERVGDVAQLREAAMLRLGKMNWKFARGGDGACTGEPTPTSDFDEIRKIAREAAAERDQRVAISDLIDAFPAENGCLYYGRRDVAEAVPSIIARVENALAPRVVEFMSKFEADVHESAHRQLAGVLQELGDGSRQVQEQQATALSEFSDQFERAFEVRLERVLQQFEDRLQRRLGEEPPPPGGFWQRYGLTR